MSTANRAGEYTAIVDKMFPVFVSMCLSAQLPRVTFPRKSSGLFLTTFFHLQGAYASERNQFEQLSPLVNN